MPRISEQHPWKLVEVGKMRYSVQAEGQTIGRIYKRFGEPGKNAVNGWLGDYCPRSYNYMSKRHGGRVPPRVGEAEKLTRTMAADELYRIAVKAGVLKGDKRFPHLLPDEGVKE